MQTAFLFAGQGAQYPGMAEDIYREYAVAREVFLEANDILGRNISELAFTMPESILNLTTNTQPAMLTVEVAILRVLRAMGIPAPKLVAGFSLGEWAALIAADVLSFSDALKLVQLRAELMQEAVPVGIGGMAVILGRDASFVDGLCKQAGPNVFPSNFNCPGQVTVAGRMEDVDVLLQIAQNDGVVAKKLPISIPSHCVLMQPAADRLEVAVVKVKFAEPLYPVVMNSTAQAVTRPEDIRKNIVCQLVNPVKFEASLEAMMEDGVDTFVEIGPGKTLSGFAKKTAKKHGREINSLRAENLETIHAVSAMFRE